MEKQDLLSLLYLSHGQRNDESQVVSAGNVCAGTNAPQLEEGPAVHGDREQLDHGHGRGKRERVEDHLPDHVVAAAHDVPQDAQGGYVEVLARLLAHSACTLAAGGQVAVAHPDPVSHVAGHRCS